MRRSAASAAVAPSVSPEPTATPNLSWAATPRRPRGRRRFWRITANVAFIILAVGWFFLLRPTWLGGPATVVRVTGVSMEPSMHSGDLAIVHDQDSYDVGDVVAFQVVGAVPDARPFVIHRIVAIEDGTYTLRGDNNDHDDPWEVRDGDIAGRLWLHVPDMGSWVSRLMDPVLLAALAAATTAFLVAIGPSGEPAEASPAGDAGRRRRGRSTSLARRGSRRGRP